MEEALHIRLQVRHQRMVQLTSEAKEMLDGGQLAIDTQAFSIIQLNLKGSVEAFEKESLLYLEKCTNKNLDVTSHLSSQMEAEDILVRLEAVKILNTSATDRETRPIHQSARLPKLELTKFNGDTLKWTEFWDCFKANIHTRHLTDVEKLSYLFGVLEGDALGTVQGLAATNTNYSVAIDLLTSRYGSRERVVDAHYDALNNVERCKNEATACRHTLNRVERHLRVLASLGEDTNGSHLRVVITAKFPKGVMYEVKLLNQTEDIDSLRKTLDHVITALERAEIQAEPPKSPSHSSHSTEVLHISSRKRGPVARQHQQPPSKTRKLECVFCKQSHYNDACNMFQTMQERKEKLIGKCYKCLKPGHSFRACKQRFNCPYCRGLHNRALCPDKTPAVARSKTLNSVTPNLATSGSYNVNTVNSMLQTATASVRHNNSNYETCRLLLDCGSQRSYITKHLAKKLNLTPDKEDQLMIYTFGSKSPNETSSPSAKIELETKRGVQRSIRVNIVQFITNRIPIQQIGDNFPVDVRADDNSCGQSINLLIGNDYYFSFIREGNLQIDNNLFLINTDFGWLLSGSIDTNEKGNVLSVVTYCQCHEPECSYFNEPDLPLRTIDMKFLWTLESIGISDSPKTTREEEAVKFFNDTVQYREGRYEVKWPWISYPPELSSNFGLAFGRLKSLLRRSDANTLRDYQEILEEQASSGIIEVVEAHPIDSNVPVHYLPHHIIKQEGKKGRIVYDASAKIKDQKCLNECMYRGPSMIEDMTALILKFRIGKVGLIADVEKAFLQVGLQEEDREVTRFLWVKDLSKEPSEDNLLYLRFCRVPFGIISSPFLLTATIRYHLSRTSQHLLKGIADKCYVDNLITNADSVTQALEMFEETKTAFDELSMNIRDWASNSKDFLERIPESVRAVPREHTKVLGLLWNVEDDVLQLKLNENFFAKEVVENTKTKKDVLKMLARFYDPCGFISPLIMPAKLFFQELCNRKLKWDAVIPKELKKTWETIIANLSDAMNLRLPRCVGDIVPEKGVQYELHCFTDASKNSYAAVVYMRVSNDDDVRVFFLMSKARVTPVEDKDDLKIPRLELLGYLIGNRLLKYINDNLDVTIDKLYLWTDSIIVLSWMKSNKLLPPFVSRRINEIKQNKGVEYRYVNTKENPADLATRPELWLQKKDLWLNGPTFLTRSKELWSENTYAEGQIVLFAAGEALDTDSPGVSAVSEPIPEDDPMPVDSTPVSTSEEPPPLPIREIVHSAPSEVETIKILQAESFPEEVRGSETHLTRNLGLFIDVDGLLRCKGRMTNTGWSYDKKHPILLSRNCSFTSQVIQETHEANYHVGVSHTLSLIREKYWIPQGRVEVQKILKKCPQCVKHGGGPFQLPHTPSLPTERVNYSTPFTYTGIDYFGPMFVDTKTGQEKRWISLLTCLAVRAVHLEIVDNLSAEQCLLALRRFTASRGVPLLIVSDNATQFKLTSEICASSNLKWRFIPQLAPWHGGFYERLVALVKHCLKRTLEKHLLNDSQLLTVIKEVEAIVNTRPLVRVGSEVEHVLKPSDFLSMGNCLEISISEDKSNTNTKTDLISSWKRGQTVRAEFQRMFQDQYLASLRERYKHSCKQPRVKSHREPRLGDIVQIKDDSNKNRNNWKVGKIVSLIKSRDGEYRIAKVKVGKTEFTRSIGHLYPLEDEVGPISTEFEEATVLKEPVPKDTDEAGDSMSRVTIEIAEKSVPAVSETTETNPAPPELAESDSVNLRDPIHETEENESSGQEVVINEDEIENIQVYEEQTNETPVNTTREKRDAAIRARQKIAEWTQQLMNLL